MPLPDNMPLQEPNAKEWPLIPADVYQAEITDIEYKTEPNRYKKYATDPDEKQYMNFTFTIIEEGANYGRKVWQKMSMIKPYPPKQNGKATWVYRLATAMEGHPVTKGEADKFTSSNINDYIHRQVKINVIQSVPDNNGKVWNNVDSFITAREQLPPFDEKKVPKENLADPAPPVQPATAVAEPVQPVTPVPVDPAAEVSPAKAAMQRGIEKHQTQQEADEIDVSDIPF